MMLESGLTQRSVSGTPSQLKVTEQHYLRLPPSVSAPVWRWPPSRCSLSLCLFSLPQLVLFLLFPVFLHLPCSSLLLLSPLLLFPLLLFIMEELATQE